MAEINNFHKWVSGAKEELYYKEDVYGAMVAHTCCNTITFPQIVWRQYLQTQCLSYLHTMKTLSLTLQCLTVVC